MNPDCRACEGIEPLTPESVANRPGLPALRYRAGRHGSFLESMIARLSAQFEAPAAPGDDSGRIDAPSRPTGAYRLQTREPGDPSIALLDAWATVGDVLSFYQERIANEGYLRTAQEERSLHELAGLVGYKLRPALSSSVHLAFDVQEPPVLDPNVPPPKPHNVLIPKGTQVKSIPGSGELPQTFETSEELTARPEWNSLKPLTTQPIVIGAEDELTPEESAFDITRLRFNGMNHNLQAGDLLLLVPSEASDSQGEPVVRQILKTYPDEPRRQTVAELTLPPFSYPKYRVAVIEGSLRFLTAVKATNFNDSRFENLLAPWRHIAQSSEQFFEGVSFLADADAKLSHSLSDPRLVGTNSFHGVLSRYKSAREVLRQVNERGSDQDGKDALTTELMGLPKHFAMAHAPSAIKSGQNLIVFTTEYLRVFDSHLGTLLEEPPNKNTITNSVIGNNTTTSTLIGVAAQHSIDSEPRTLNRKLHEFHDRIGGAWDDITAQANENIRDAIADTFSVAVTAGDTNEDILNKTKNRLKELKLWLTELNESIKEQENRMKRAPWNADSAAEGGLLGELEWADAQADNQQWLLAPTSPFMNAAASDLAGYWRASRAKSAASLVDRMMKIREELCDWTDEEKAWLDQTFSDVTDGDSVRLERLGKTIFDLSKGMQGRTDAPSIPFEVVLNRPGMLAADLAIENLRSDWEKAPQAIANSVISNLDSLKSTFEADSAAHNAVQSLRDEIRRVSSTPTSASKSGLINAIQEILDQQVLLVSPIPSAALLIRNSRDRLSQGLKIKVKSRQRRETPSVLDFTSIPALDGKTPPITEVGLGAEHFGTIFKSQGSDLVTRLRERLGGNDQRRAFEALSVRLEPRRSGRVYRFRVRAGLFGASQSTAVNLAVKDGKLEGSPVDPINFSEEPREPNVLFLDNEHSDIGPDTWCLIGTIAPDTSGPVISLRAEDFRGLKIRGASVLHRSAHRQSGKTIRLELQDAWRDPWTENSEFRRQLRSTLVLAASVELPLAEEVIETPFPDGDQQSGSEHFSKTDKLKLSDYQGDLETGRTIAISGEQVVPLPGATEGRPTGTMVTSIHRIVSASSSPDATRSRIRTELRITPELEVRFRRDTVRIYANIVEATHGERFSEVLGNGEGQGAFQRFQLSQRGLTHLPAMTPSGMQSELELRVNNVAWELAERIGELQASSSSTLRIFPSTVSRDQPLRYLTAFDDEARTFITTGDGMTTGARLPTGVANIRVQYRVGGGRSGNVKEGMITQMMAPPLNVTKVRNPLSATGGVDREGVDQARSNVPVSVQALDRLVSITDYASFARRFAGIAKAQATPLQTDRGAEVVLTIAGLDDVPIDKESLLFRNLQSSLDGFDDPEYSVRLIHRELILLLLWARVKIAPKYQFAEVEGRVRKRLLAAFDFERAELGKDVLLSDVVEVIQNTPGVQYVDVDMFDSMRQFYGSGALIEKAEAIAGVRQVNRHEPCKRPIPPQPLQTIVVRSARLAGDDNDYYLSNCVAGLKASLPDPRPAQLAYFADLPGTILLEEIR